MDDSWKLPRRVVASVIAAGIMSFSGVVVESSMNVTFPSLMREFGIDTATVQWITTGYLLVLSVIIPMSRGVDSLNVAASSAVAFWQLFS